MSEGGVWLPRKEKDEERASEIACLFPWKVTTSEKRSASSFCSREVSRLASGTIIDGFGRPGALLERAA